MWTGYLSTLYLRQKCANFYDLYLEGVWNFVVTHQTGFVQTLECPGILLFRIAGLEISAKKA